MAMFNHTDYIRQGLMDRALRSGIRKDGSWGADLAALCKEGYKYVGKGDVRACAVVDKNIGKDGKKIDPLKKHDYSKVFFFTTGESLSTIRAPKARHTGCLKIDPLYPGANIFVSRQYYKQSYVSRDEWDAMDESEHYKYRTTFTKHRNDNKRKHLIAKKAIQKRRHEKYGASYKPEKFDEAMAKTRKNDELNPYCGYCGTMPEDIMYYTDLCIYLDNDRLPAFMVQKAVDKLVKMLRTGRAGKKRIKAYAADYFVPAGDGLEIHFQIVPTHAKKAWKLRKVIRAICREYAKVCREYAPELYVNIHKSNRIAAYTRMPGSYNTSVTDEDGSPYKIREIRSLIRDKDHCSSIQDFIDYYGLEHEIPAPAEALRKKTEPKRKKNVYSNKRAEKMLPMLKDMAPSITGKKKSDFLFMSGTLAKEAGCGQKDFLTELNSLFEIPVADSEIERLVKNLGKKDYHYRTDTIADRYCLNDSDFAPYGLSIAGDYETDMERTRRRAEEKAGRDKSVINLLFAQKKNISETSRISGLCRATVRKIRDAFIEEAKAVTKKKAAAKASFTAGIKAVTGAARAVTAKTYAVISPKSASPLFVPVKLTS